MNKNGIIMIIIVIGLTLYFGASAYEELKNLPIRCDKYENVKFRYEGSGGIFGGVHRVETLGENFDGYMQKCIEGDNLFGRKVKR